MSDVPTLPVNLPLNNGVEIPQVGFGVFQIPADEVVDPVLAAIDAGYRLIDTAAAYGNEEGVGKAMANSGIDRDELFVTTKVWNTDHGYDAALRAFDESSSKLGLDVLDLYLIHWPQPKRDQFVETWKALEKLYADGRVRAIGVSNFHAQHLNRLFDEADVKPAVNQVEVHPGFNQEQLRAFNAEHGIVTEAWSPIGQGSGLLDDPTVTTIAERLGRTPAQVVLRWHVQLGNVVIPKSSNPERIRSNFQLFDFELSGDDMAALTGMTGSGRGRLGPNPEQFESS